MSVSLNAAEDIFSQRECAAPWGLSISCLQIAGVKYKIPQQNRNLRRQWAYKAVVDGMGTGRSHVVGAQASLFDRYVKE